MKLKDRYHKKSVPELKKKLKLKNDYATPKISKVIVSIGLSDLRFDKEGPKLAVSTIKSITGQKPKSLKAKKAISNFKVRKGQIVAYMTTLRGEKMYDFVDKLFNVTLPRIREFRGIPLNSIDASFNVSIGIKEQLSFPEIKAEETEKIHGLGITIVTTAKSKEEAAELLGSLGAVTTEEKIEKERKEKEEE